jgi:hypothetical protein
MSIVSRCASRLIATITLAVIIPAVASASDIERDGRFKLAMGPMSAAQKNQGNTTAESMPAEPHVIPKHHHHHAHRRHHHSRHI